jgi:hypothetical protein
MSAPAGNTNALGNTGGKTLNDRKLAAEVRSLALSEIKAILKQAGMSRLKTQILLKLAPSILPRLNEHTGKDGDDLFPTPILNGMNVPDNDSNQENSPTEETDSGNPGRNLSE